MYCVNKLLRIIIDQCICFVFQFQFFNHSVLHLNLVHFKHLMHNLVMQIIAGIVEHRFSDAFSSQILLVNMLSFVVRTLNSYWGTQVRITSNIIYFEIS